MAKCKGVLFEDIGVDDALIETIDLHGDDFMAIAAYIHRKYNVRPSEDKYRLGMTIRDWAKLICNEGQ